MNAGSAGQRRRLPVWIVWSAGGLGLLGTVALVLWLQLPRWAPEWVIRNSPFVDPVLRAFASQPGLPRLEPHSELEWAFFNRAQSWNEDAVPALLRATDTWDVEHRAAALYALASLGSHRIPLTDGDVDRFACLAAEGQEARQRVWALTILHARREPGVAALRRTATGDPDRWVRYAALVGLDPRADPRDGQVLIDRLRVETDPELLTSSIEAVGRFRLIEALPALGELAQRSAGLSGTLALRTAYEISPSASVGVLLAGLTSPQPNARVIAVMRLGELRAPRAVDPMLAMLTGSDEQLTGLALIALCRIGDPAVIEPVLARLDGHLAEFAGLRYREHERQRVPDSVRMAEDFDYQALLDLVDGLPMTAPQRARWQAMRAR